MRFWFGNVMRLGLKELASLRMDHVLAALIVYSFTMTVYSKATGMKTEVENARIAIVDGDRSTLSERIRAAFLRPYFQPAAELDRIAIDPAMDGGDRTFVLDLPPQLEADLLRGREPIIQVNIDATAMTQAGLGAGYIDGIVRQEVAAFLNARGTDADLPVRAVIRSFFNPNLEGLWFRAIMAVIENITILSILLAGAAVIREREHGTIEHLLVMPVRASEIAFAKIWANGLVILTASGLSLVVVVMAVLRVPIEGSVPLFLLGTAFYLFATTALGIWLSTLVRSMPQFALLAIPVFLVINMLSGASSPLESMPKLLQVLIQVSPAVHFVKLAQAVLYRGAGLDIVWLHMVVLAGLGALFLALALGRFRGMLANLQR